MSTLRVCARSVQLGWPGVLFCIVLDLLHSKHTLFNNMDGFFLSSSCQTIICVVKLDSICYTRKPNGRWPQRCLSRRPPLHRLSLLRFTPPQIIFMCTWLAAIMCRPAWPGVTVPVNKAVTPVVLKKIIKTDFTTAPVITHGRCFMRNMCAALWASCHSSRTMPVSSWSYF